MRKLGFFDRLALRRIRRKGLYPAWFWSHPSTGGALGIIDHTGGISNNWSTDKALLAYHSWVAACINIIANNIAKVKLRLFVKLGNGNIRAVDDHPLLRLMEWVNPIHNKFELIKMTITWLELDGNTYWRLLRDNMGVPVEIEPLLPNTYRGVTWENSTISGYRFWLNNRVVEFPAADIVHFRYPHPRDLSLIHI